MRMREKRVRRGRQEAQVEGMRRDGEKTTNGGDNVEVVIWRQIAVLVWRRQEDVRWRWKCDMDRDRWVKIN